MNYLGHLYLSRHYPQAMMGNLLTDMLSQAELKSRPEALESGILLHHLIDNFTDSHPENQKARKILHPYFRKYAGVALDIYYDYILAQNWEIYSSQQFGVFESAQYAIIREQELLIPKRLRYTIQKMINDRFLYRFTTLNGQSYAFANMDHRARFDTGFHQAIEVLKRHMPELTSHFNLFFPMMIKEVDSFIDSSLDSGG